MTKLIKPLLVLACFAAGCAPKWEPDYYCKGYEPPVDSVEAKIVNGEPITEETNLSTLVLWDEDVGWPHCSAVALDPHVVLTAAHCITTSNLGVARSLKSFRIKVDDIYVHRQYTPGFQDYDLAVLHLEEPIEGPFPAGIYDAAAGGFDPDVRYFCTHMVAQGFGTTLGTKPKNELYSIPYEIGYNYSLTVLKTGPVNPEQGICYGDSGGGLYAFVQDHPWYPEPTFLLVGIAVAGEDGETCTGETAHVNLDLQQPWLREVRYCLGGGEDRQWPFYLLGNGGYRGSTCAELKKEL